jgi:ribosomal protein L11 methyltransferase
MPWLQVRFPAECEQAQRLSDALEECGAISVSIEHVDSGSVWVESDWNEQPVWQRSRVTALFPEHADVNQLLGQLRQFGVEPPVPATHLLADEDWESSWKENYHPLQISTRLWICPSWRAPPDPAAVNVILDPGMAFGTGDHPTTALCLEWLAEQDLSNKDVIDYGCGSGILSIAALKLGARSALGVDIDPQALDVSRRNTELNGVGERFTAYLPDALPAHVGADIVIANILARPLAELAPHLMARVRPGGRLALSGLLREQEDMVRPHYEAQCSFERRRRGEWLLFAGRKRA